MELSLKQISESFCVPGHFLRAEELKNGNINRTYRVFFSGDDGVERSYILQRLNTYVFRRPEEVMDNIRRISAHITAKGQESSALQFCSTPEGKLFLLDDEDGFWRLFNYVESVTYNECDDLRIVHGAGAAFGQFQMMLSDFDAASLYETIPGFHHTGSRYEQLMLDAEKDPCGLVHEVQDEL